MSDVFSDLYAVIEDRKKNPAAGSYTCYLFREGTDKILKKVGEEAAEVLIAAKNGDNERTKEELCDLIYHLFVLMANADIPLSEIRRIIAQRSEKIGNLKPMRDTDKNT